MKINRQIIYVFLVFIGSIVLICCAMYQVVTPHDISNVFFAMFGTFLGALFAFRLNESKDLAKIDKDRKSALNHALFILARQHNALQSFAKHLALHSTDFDRAFNLPAQKPPSYSDLIHDFQELEFLLESSDPDVLMRLAVEQESFHQTIESIRIRNEFYVNELQPALALSNLNFRRVSLNELEARLGVRLISTAISAAKNLYFHVESTEASLAAMRVDLFKVAKIIFPKDLFIKYS